jgi:nucleoside-diphosphate-sugar epimerase
MRIFVAGATGALGRRLVPLLVAGGHQVTGMTRTPGRTMGLFAAGAEPVVADALDRDAVLAAVVAARPEVVVHQLTDVAGATDLRRFDEGFASTNRLRTEGTDHLLAAARAAGARPPRRVPVWLARLLAGSHGVVLMTEARGAANAKAKRELGWRPAYPSWRQGFRTGLGLPNQDHALAP